MEGRAKRKDSQAAESRSPLTNLKRSRCPQIDLPTRTQYRRHRDRGAGQILDLPSLPARHPPPALPRSLRNRHLR